MTSPSQNPAFIEQYGPREAMDYDVVIVGGDTKWTGTAMYVESVDSAFDATGIATVSASFTGLMALTDNP